MKFSFEFDIKASRYRYICNFYEDKVSIWMTPFFAGGDILQIFYGCYNSEKIDWDTNFAWDPQFLYDDVIYNCNRRFKLMNFS